MRFVPSFFDRVKGDFLGDNAPNGRVTVEPGWQLKKTAPVYGSSVRGPFKYFRDVADSGVEYEVPNIKSISINRSLSEDVAKCTITMYNTWHESNTVAPELVGQLGKPGNFWPKRGETSNVWNQTAAKGAYRKDGVWDPNFSWANVLVQNAMLITRQGYGGVPSQGNYVSVQDNIDAGNILPTGIWLIDTVVGGSDGLLNITCRDIGRILLDQIVFPPLVPGGLYPLEYYPAGKSSFDSMFGPRVSTGLAPGSKGEVRVTPHPDSTSGVADSSRSGFPVSNSLDGLDGTYGLTEAFPSPIADNLPFFQYNINQKVSSLYLLPWAGGYECYIHVMEGGVWKGSQSVSLANSGPIPYVKKINVPLYVPDGHEKGINIDLPGEYNVERMIISFQNLYYSNVASSAGYRYRGGIRTLIAYREGLKEFGFDPDVTTTPWTFSMEKHPTRGYWVGEMSGTIHGFGDAHEYDSTSFGAVPLSSKHPANRMNAIAAHPDGKGYWALDVMGNVWAYGSATHYGQYTVAWPGFDTVAWGQEGVQAWDIAATCTGNGYWVVYSDGVIRAFGDAVGTSGFSGGVATIPDTPVSDFMVAFQPLWKNQRKATSIASHPNEIGCWVTDGSGQVWAFGITHYGQLHNRVYDAGMASEFALGSEEFTHAIEATATGRGYWIAFGSGRIAAFGDARGQGPTNIYENLTSSYEDNIVIDEIQLDPSFFRSLIWSLARDPDGTGFWILMANGSVGSYNAEFWGQPSYTGGSGLRWHEGNFSGDASDIVKELLCWSGFTLYDPVLSPSEKPPVFGAIESTGINTDTIISGDKWDKKTIMDVIKELAEITAYQVNVDENGRFIYRSGNIWRAGNFDEDGSPIYVTYDEDGVFTRVAVGTPEAVPFIPTVSEMVDLHSYSASLESQDMRSEIIIGSSIPDPKDASKTSYVRYIPPSANEFVSSGVSKMRGIDKPAIWQSVVFEKPEEMQLMAEMIALRAWFGERVGSAECVFNPAISIDDQVRIVERNTSESFIHRVTGIDSTMDLDSGVATMSLQTHWLGNADNWVITRTPQPGATTPYTVISEQVDRWQMITSRGLGEDVINRGTISRLCLATFEFDNISSSVSGSSTWEGQGSLTLYTKANDVVVSVSAFTAPINSNSYLRVYAGNTLIKNLPMPGVGQNVNLGQLGVLNTPTEYTFTVGGDLVRPGSGQLEFKFSSPDFNAATVSDSLIVVS